MAAGLSACGGSSGGPAAINWYIFPEPSGSFAAAAKDCCTASGGRYNIVLNTLPSDADSQRTQLVRRLAAKDNAIDIIGMDVNWTAEFAEAGWIKPWTGANGGGHQRRARRARSIPRRGRASCTARRSTPTRSCSGTARTSYPSRPPTWDADDPGRARARQAGQTALHRGPGTPVRGSHGVVQLARQLRRRTDPQRPDEGGDRPGRRARRDVIHDLANSPAADPGLSNAQEDQTRAGIREGEAAFEVNYPFVYPSAQQPTPKSPRCWATRHIRTWIPARRPRSRSAASTSVSRRIRRTQPRHFAAVHLPGEREAPDSSTRSRAACPRRSPRSMTTRHWPSPIRSTR